MIMISHIQVAVEYAGFKSILVQYHVNVDQCRRITARVERHQTTNLLAVYFDYGLQKNAQLGDIRVLMSTRHGVPVVNDCQVADALKNRQEATGVEFETIGEIVESVDVSYWKQ